MFWILERVKMSPVGFINEFTVQSIAQASTDIMEYLTLKVALG